MCPDHLVSKQDMHYLQLRSYINDSWKNESLCGWVCNTAFVPIQDFLYMGIFFQYYY